MTAASASCTLFSAIYPGEELRLRGDWRMGRLIVHLGEPATTIELGDHHLVYEEIEFRGVGRFEIKRHGRVVDSWSR